MRQDNYVHTAENVVEEVVDNTRVVYTTDDIDTPGEYSGLRIGMRNVFTPRTDWETSNDCVRTELVVEPVTIVVTENRGTVRRNNVPDVNNASVYILGSEKSFQEIMEQGARDYRLSYRNDIAEVLRNHIV